MPTRRVSRAGLAAALLSVAVTACEGSDRDSFEPPQVAETPWSEPAPDLVIDAVAGTNEAPVAFMVKPPSASVSTVSAGGARLRSVPGPVPEHPGVLFPGAVAAGRGRLAVLRVDPGMGSSPLLEPGDADFQLGLDVLLPHPAVRSDTDNGDNLVQRGLFGDEGQLKLQIDGGQPSCRVAGDEGVVTVEADTALTSGTWFRLRCQRTRGRVTLYVGRIDPTGMVTSWSHWSEEGATGRITFGDPAPLISIGGKLSPQGGVVPDAPDQFSGALSQVVYGAR
jgi:hypothetical protein